MNVFENELKERKLEVASSGELERALRILPDFASKEAIINVPQKELFEIFDRYCDSIGEKRICHRIAGSAIRQMYSLKRKCVRTPDEVIAVYVEAN